MLINLIDELIFLEFYLKFIFNNFILIKSIE